MKQYAGLQTNSLEGDHFSPRCISNNGQWSLSRFKDTLSSQYGNSFLYGTSPFLSGQIKLYIALLAIEA